MSKNRGSVGPERPVVKPPELGLKSSRPSSEQTVNGSLLETRTKRIITHPAQEFDLAGLTKAWNGRLRL